jgi:hypothetical protein
MAVGVQVDIPYSHLQLGKAGTLLSPQGGGRRVPNGCAVRTAHAGIYKSSKVFIANHQAERTNEHHHHQIIA